MDIWLPPKPAIIRPAEPKLIKANSFIPGMAGVVGLVGQRNVLTYLGSDQDEVDRTQYTFSLSFGPEDPRRRLVAALSGRCGGTSRTLDQVTIGGVTADIDITRLNFGNSQNGNASIVSFDIPTGTSGNVVATYSGTISACAISLYRLIGPYDITLHDTDPPEPDVSSLFNMTLDVPKDGMIVACRAGITTSGAASWTGVDENYDDGEAHSHASKTGLKAQSGYSVTVNSGGIPARYCCASYG